MNNNLDLKTTEEDVIYERRKLEEYIEKEKNEEEEYKVKLERIKKLFFEDNAEFFDEIKMYLKETLDYDLLSNPIWNCIRFELYDSEKNKRMFFAINKNMFSLTDFSKHKLNLRGNSSEEKMLQLYHKLKEITNDWRSIYSNAGKYYWGLTIFNDNKVNLYVGKSSFPNNWENFIAEINNIIEDLMNDIIKEILI